MEDFIYKGALFFRRLSYFRTIEDSQRGDLHEGISFSCSHMNTNLKMEVSTSSGEKFVFKDFCSPVIGINNLTYNPLVYCMFGVKDEDITNTFTFIPNECHKFGNYAVIIRDPKEFIKRLENTLGTQNGVIKYTFVKYVSKEDYSGPMGPFFKYDSFSHQKEFRIIYETMCNDKRDSLNLNIGNIENIASIASVDRISWKRT